MPITGINWSRSKGALVVHVLPGIPSPDLRAGYLFFQLPAEDRIGTVTNDQSDHDFPSAKSYLEDPAHGGDVTLSFTIADASVAPGESTRSFRHIQVDRATGQVTADLAAFVEPFPRNFLLEVKATCAGRSFPELIRVELHRSIQRIWLTPDPLRVRARRNAIFPSTTRSRFSLRALFDDDVVGDITEFFAIDWLPTRNIEADGRVTVAAGDAGSTAITVTARLRAFPTLEPATAALLIQEPWSPDDPIDVRLVPGGGSPHPLAIEAVPNVLFLPDGFPADWEEDFYRYVNALVQFLKTDTVCKPYDLLADSINFWAAFIESEQEGVTWSSDVSGLLDQEGLRAIPKPERGPGGENGWELQHLIYEVGLPTARDAASNSARSNEDITDEWDALFGSTYQQRIESEAALERLVNEWRRLAARTILDDIDTPLGTRSGAPRVDGEYNGLRMNRARMDRERLDDLMSALRHDDFDQSHLDLSTLWLNPLKRNYDLVCIVVPNVGRAQNADGYFFVNQVRTRRFTGAGVALVVDPPTFSARPESRETRLFAHEFSHSFSLGDEYGGDEASRLTQPTVDRAQRAFPNLQSPNSLKRAGSIHGDEIKWRWPRLSWAAELIGPITPGAGGVFEAPIRANHALAFPIGELVHLRFRDIDFGYRDVRYIERSAYLTKLPQVSVPLRLVETFETGTPSVVNVRLRVDAAAAFPYPAESTVQAADFAAQFPAGSIVYRPTRAPDVAYDAVSYPYAEVMAKNIREFITQRVADGDDGTIGAAGLGFPQEPDYSGFTFPHCFPTAQYPHVVALYAGGIGNDTGIYHPTGDCMMSNEYRGSQFCHVCKYMLVDAIDPSKHSFLDREYLRFYPQR
ncbi:MAG: hypothetical protein ABW061_19020 [Polyangiaceae bacterium]